MMVNREAETWEVAGVVARLVFMIPM